MTTKRGAPIKPRTAPNNIYLTNKTLFLRRTVFFSELNKQKIIKTELELILYKSADTTMTTRIGRHRNGVRFTRFVFTLNNYTDAEYDSLCNMPNVKWIVLGKEIAQTGTPHIQGAVILEKQTSLRALKNIPGLTRAHMERMKGSPEDSLAYCSKEDPKPFVKGTFPQPGKRNDIHVACDLIKSGKSLQQIAEEMPATVVRNYKGLIYLRSLLLEGRRDKPIVFWLWGKTGTGKTRSAVEFGQHFDRFWISSCNLKWYDGYDGQPVAIFDDIRSESINYNTFLRLLDRYCLSVEYKGGFTNWIPKFIIVTCPVEPSDLFSHKPNDDIAQLLRRIDYIVDFDKNPYDEAKPNVLLNLLEANHTPDPNPSTGSHSDDDTEIIVDDEEKDKTDLDALADEVIDAILEEKNNEVVYSPSDLLQARLNTALGAFNTRHDAYPFVDEHIHRYLYADADRWGPAPGSPYKYDKE